MAGQQSTVLTPVSAKISVALNANKTAPAVIYPGYNAVVVGGSCFDKSINVDPSAYGYDAIPATNNFAYRLIDLPVAPGFSAAPYPTGYALHDSIQGIGKITATSATSWTPVGSNFGVVNWASNYIPPADGGGFVVGNIDVGSKLLILGKTQGIIAKYRATSPAEQFMSDSFYDAFFISIPNNYFDPVHPAAAGSFYEVTPDAASGAGNSAGVFFWIGLTDPSQIPTGIYTAAALG